MKEVQHLHINAAQTLLKQQFPHVPGLQDPTLAETQTFDAQFEEFVQVLHTAGCHWVAVARLGSQESEIQV